MSLLPRIELSPFSMPDAVKEARAHADKATAAHLERHITERHEWLPAQEPFPRTSRV